MNKEQDIFKTLVEKVKEINLTERERSKLFLAVDTFIERNPIQEETFAQEQKPELGFVKSPFSIKDFTDRLSHFHAYSFRTVGALLLLAIFGTGTSFAAQNAVPGDILYPIKVNINEGIQAALLSGVKRSEFDVSLVKTRIEEAKKLAVENKLSDKNQAEIATRIDTYVSNVKSDLDDLTKKGDLKTAFEISSKLEASLGETATDVPAPAAGTVATAQASIVEEIVKGPREISAQVRENTEDQIYTLQTNDDTTLVIAQTKLESVKKALTDIEEKMNLAMSTSSDVATMAMIAAPTAKVQSKEVATSTEITVKGKAVIEIDTHTEPVVDEPTDLLEHAYDLLRQGEEKLNNKEYNEAFRLFRDAYEITETIQSKFDVENGDISFELDKIISDLETAVSQIDTVEMDTQLGSVIGSQ